MDDWTRVLLYGTFDGFTYSTDDFPRTVVVLDSGERVEVPEECVVSADEMVNKYKIKLKDVIKRIEMFDLGTKAVWINEILNKLGSDYGLHKYYAGYKQGEFDGAMGREKVTVPHFIAEYIEFKKKYDFHVYGAMREIENHYDKRVPEWFYEKNVETFVRAWLDGYEVEKEKRYRVKMKDITISTRYLKYNTQSANWFLSGYEEAFPYRTKHTRKELEEAGFGWVFDCEGIEIEEVE